MARKQDINVVIKQANRECWNTEEVFAVYCTAWSGGPMKKDSHKVQLIGSYDDCHSMLKRIPHTEMPLSMVELAEGYTLRTNYVY